MVATTTSTSGAKTAETKPAETKVSGADASKASEATLAENSVISTDVDPGASANPGEIKTGISADRISPSGSISEPAAVADIPVDHPAVDDNPRKNQPAESNRIDFNNPAF